VTSDTGACLAEEDRVEGEEGEDSVLEPAEEGGEGVKEGEGMKEGEGVKGGEIKGGGGVDGGEGVAEVESIANKVGRLNKDEKQRKHGSPL